MGETGLILENRRKSHEKDKNSAIRGHCHDFDAFDWDFLCRAHNTNERKILESLHIREKKPALNRNQGVDPYVFV